MTGLVNPCIDWLSLQYDKREESGCGYAGIQC